MNLIHWFHHIFNPHCPQCAMDKEIEYTRKYHCRACEFLERQLEIERDYNKLLLHRVTNYQQEVAPVKEIEDNEIKPIKRGPRSFVPFAVREQMARQNDMQTLELLKLHHIESNTPIITNEMTMDTDEKVEKLEAEILGTNILENVK